MRNFFAFVFFLFAGVAVHSICFSTGLIDDLETIRSIVDGRFRYNKSLLLAEQNEDVDSSAQADGCGLREDIAALLRGDLGQASVRADYRFYELLKTIIDRALETKAESQQRQIDSLFFYTYAKREQDQDGKRSGYFSEDLDETEPCREILEHIESHVSPELVAQIGAYIVFNDKQILLYAYPERPSQKARDKGKEILDRSETTKKRILEHARHIERLIQEDDASMKRFLSAYQDARSKKVVFSADVRSIIAKQCVLSNAVTENWTTNPEHQVLSLDTYQQLSQKVLPGMLDYAQHIKRHRQLAMETLDAISAADELLSQILPNPYLAHLQKQAGASKSKTRKKTGGGRKKPGRQKTKKADEMYQEASGSASSASAPVDDEVDEPTEKAANIITDEMTDDQKLDALFGKVVAQPEPVAEKRAVTVTDSAVMDHQKEVHADEIETVASEQVSSLAVSQAEAVIEDWMIDLSQKRQITLDATLKSMEKTFMNNGFSIERRSKKVFVHFVSPINQHKIRIYYDTPHGAQLKKKWPAWRFNFRDALRDAGYVI